MDPITKLRKSLRHVIDLLDDVDIRIFQQRKRIEDLGGRLRIGAEMPEWMLNMTDIVEDLNSQQMDTAPKNFKGLLDRGLLVKNVSNKTPEKKPTTVHVNTKLQIKLKMKKLMAKTKAGYCYAALAGIADAILEKENDEVNRLIEAAGKIIARMSSDGKLGLFGDTLINRIKYIWLKTSSLPDKIVKDNVYDIRQAFVNNHLNDDVNKIINRYGTFFTMSEGEKLLNKVEELYKYDATHEDSATTQSLMESFFETFLAPAYRKRDSIELQGLIVMLNKIYPKKYPNPSRSEIDDVMNIVNNFDDKETAKSALRPHISVKFTKTEFKKMLQQSVSAPNLMKQFIEHFKHKEKNKYLNSHIKSIVQSRSHYQKNDRQTIFISKHAPVTKPTTVSHKTRPTLFFYEATVNLTKNLNAKAMKLRTGIAKTQMKKLKEKNTTKNIIKIQPKTTRYIKLSSMLISTKKIHHRKRSRHNKTMLHVIVSDSSYSDEEIYLKTMLHNALGINRSNVPLNKNQRPMRNMHKHLYIKSNVKFKTPMSYNLK